MDLFGLSLHSSKGHFAVGIKEEAEFRVAMRVVAFLVTIVFTIVFVWMVGMPYYWIFHQHMEGKAALAKTEYTKQTLIQEAKAKEESARYLAEAEVTRAKGVAEANRIIGASLKDNDGYLHYLWIHNLESGSHDVIYVPTEAGLPIFEAGGRFSKSPRKPDGNE
jgi:hypothetical protein